MKSIKRILIANRGEIARRIIRTAHPMGIETVVVYSETDAHSLPVREATTAYALGGLTSAQSYLNFDKILAAAKATRADAIHPGYGFLSENAQFAKAVQDAGLTWIGPSPTSIKIVGSKAGAKQLAQTVGVPCLPGYFETDQSDAAMHAAAKRFGFPLMVKASAGGGGRGMRLVREAAQLQSAIVSARSEAIAAFGSGDLILERALLNPRHVEIQIFADTHGACIHMGERDCSVQRRHQKIIEESPSPALTPTVRQAMCMGAIKLALAAGYTGAGTVEFLLEGAGDAAQFYLMEMNTRLQVEHSVTEMRTGLDLVEWQIRVARGEALPLAQEQVRPDGHAIEVRLCAEDEVFMPQVGKILYFQSPPLSRAVRFDHALEAGSEVSPYFDAMLGKVISHQPSRTEAVDALIAALKQTEVLGLATNRAFLMACLDHAQFRSGLATVPFLLEHGDSIRTVLAKKRAAIPMSVQASALDQNQVQSRIPCPFPRPVRVKLSGQIHDVDEVSSAVQVRAVKTAKDTFHAQLDGIDWFLEDASFAPPLQAVDAAQALEVRAPFSGRVIAVNVKSGQAIAAGETLFVIESMKLEHAVQAIRVDRVLEVMVEMGQQVSPKQVLVRFAAQASP